MITQNVALARVWRHHSPCITPWRKYRNKTNFTVLSYNILSQLLLESNAYLYRNIPSQHLQQVHRTNCIIKELEDYNADIVCLQEFDHQIRDRFTAHFAEKGYKNVFQRKPDVPHAHKDDGCFMMYKTDKFQLVKDSSIGLYNSNEKLLNKPNCAQIVLLESTEGAQLCVANTHLLYNPKRGDIKLAQLSLILHDIQVMVNSDSKCGGMPVIFCGDFNTCPHAPLYNLMKSGKLQYSDYSPVRISGQKGGSSTMGNKMTPGLWMEMDFHEHGLRHRTAEDIQKCLQSHKSITPSEFAHNYVNSEGWQEYKELNCSKCKELFPYKHGSISHNIHFKSVYDHIDGDGLTKEITTYIQNDARTVDYIWYSNHFTDVDKLHKCVHGHECETQDCSASLLVCEGRRRLRTKAELTEMGRLPNSILGSDHQALEGQFTLYSEPEEVPVTDTDGQSAVDWRNAKKERKRKRRKEKQRREKIQKIITQIKNQEKSNIEIQLEVNKNIESTPSSSYDPQHFPIPCHYLLTEKKLDKIAVETKPDVQENEESYKYSLYDPASPCH